VPQAVAGVRDTKLPQMLGHLNAQDVLGVSPVLQPQSTAAAGRCLRQLGQHNRTGRHHPFPAALAVDDVDQRGCAGVRVSETYSRRIRAISPARRPAYPARISHARSGCPAVIGDDDKDSTSAVEVAAQESATSATRATDQCSICSRAARLPLLGADTR